MSPARGILARCGAELPEIIDGFYQHVTSVPQLKALVGDQVPRLKQAQTAHWKRLFSGRFDDAYFAGVRTIGAVHHRIALEPRWYIAGYTYVLNRLVALAVRRIAGRRQSSRR